MKKYSIWQENVNIKHFPKLNKNISCDVLIIGGGMTGISSLYHLKDTNLNVVLIEQRRIGMSTTSRSTGKLSFLQNDLIDKIRMSIGDDDAKHYIKSQIDAIKLIKKIIKKEKINCDLERVKSKLYTNKDNEIKELKNLKKFLESCNIKVNESNCDLIKYKYMMEVDNTYLIHPLKLISGLVSNLSNIYENTSVTKIKKDNNCYLCYTDNYIIKTKYVIIASHYPYFNIPFFFPLKASLEKSYLSCSKMITKRVSLISYSNPFISIRNYNNNIIYLSNSHMINKDICDVKHFNELIKKIKELNLNPDYLWSNTDIITNDGLPYIGKIDDNMLIATGYNTWGLATSILSGKIIKDILLNKNNYYIDLFNPKRNNLEQIIGGVGNSIKSISGFVNGFMKSNNKIKCTHMGCKLIYNKIEKTFDCPCHGSRFDKNGKVIMSPANKNIKNI